MDSSPLETSKSPVPDTPTEPEIVTANARNSFDTIATEKAAETILSPVSQDTSKPPAPFIPVEVEDTPRPLSVYLIGGITVLALLYLCYQLLNSSSRSSYGATSYLDFGLFGSIAVIGYLTTLTMWIIANYKIWNGKKTGLALATGMLGATATQILMLLYIAVNMLGNSYSAVFGIAFGFDSIFGFMVVPITVLVYIVSIIFCWTKDRDFFS